MNFVLRLAAPAALLASSVAANAQQAVRVACFDDNTGAVVTLNGRTVGTCPIDVSVQAGNVTVRAVKKVGPTQEQVWEQEFFMGAGAVKKVEVILGPPQLTAEARALELARLEAERQAALQREAEKRRREDGIRQREADRLEAARKGAEAGDPAALAEMSRRYRGGRGVARNEQQSLALLERALEARHPAAWAELANRHEYGTGVARDSAKAFELHRRSAEAGHPAGMAGLGALYFTGEGVARDLVAARMWFARAASLGNARGMMGLGAMHDFGLGVPKDLAQAESWYQKAADAGERRGLYSLGMLLKGEKKETPRAIELIVRAASLGDADAMAVHAEFLAEGAGGLQRDPGRVLELLVASAAADSEWGNYFLAHTYWERAGGVFAGLNPPDNAKARVYFERAAKLGHEQAEYVMKLFFR